MRTFGENLFARGVSREKRSKSRNPWKKIDRKKNRFIEKIFTTETQRTRGLNLKPA
jgi:hypothetical protein